MPRSVFNALMLILVITAGRACLASVLFVAPTVGELVAVPAIVAVSTFLFRVLPETSRSWLYGCLRTLLSSSAVSTGLCGLILLELLFGTFLSTVKISWSGPNQLLVKLQGRPQLLRGSPETGASPTSWEARLVRLTFFPISIEAGSYATQVRPLPFKSNKVVIPEYLADSNSGTYEVETQLDLVLLQLSQKAFHERAQKTLLALKDKIGVAAWKRLQSITDLLEEASLRSRDGAEKPRNLLLAYKNIYSDDPWLSALEASVALSERKYAEAAKILRQVVGNKERKLGLLPSRASLSAMYAVSLTRLGRDLLSDASRRVEAMSCLTDARKTLENALREGSEDRIYDAEAALRWHLGMVEFYARSDDNAITEFSRLGKMTNAEPLLVARAKNAVGYIMLLNGRLNDASRWFMQSSSMAPDLANPRINRGYLFLIKGLWREAENHFRALLKGPDALSAERDRILARLGTGLALDAGGKIGDATEEYESVLRDLRGTGAVEVEGALEPVVVRMRLAQEVYLRNRDYYALEIWGAVMLGSACKLLCRAQAERATPLFSELEEEINESVKWIFEVAQPRSALLQHKNGVLSGILPRTERPCHCEQSVRSVKLRSVAKNVP